MVELTVCFESNFVEAAERKSAKVGSRGVPDLPGFDQDSKSLFKRVISTADGHVPTSSSWIL